MWGFDEYDNIKSDISLKKPVNVRISSILQIFIEAELTQMRYFNFNNLIIIYPNLIATYKVAPITHNTF